MAIFEENRYMLDIFSDLSKVFDIQLNKYTSQEARVQWHKRK